MYEERVVQNVSKCKKMGGHHSQLASCCAAANRQRTMPLGARSSLFWSAGRSTQGHMLQCLPKTPLTGFHWWPLSFVGSCPGSADHAVPIWLAISSTTPECSLLPWRFCRNLEAATLALCKHWPPPQTTKNKRQWAHTWKVKNQPTSTIYQAIPSQSYQANRTKPCQTKHSSRRLPVSSRLCLLSTDQESWNLATCQTRCAHQHSASQWCLFSPWTLLHRNSSLQSRSQPGLRRWPAAREKPGKQCSGACVRGHAVGSIPCKQHEGMIFADSKKPGLRNTWSAPKGATGIAAEQGYVQGSCGCCWKLRAHCLRHAPPARHFASLCHPVWNTSPEHHENHAELHRPRFHHQHLGFNSNRLVDWHSFVSFVLWQRGLCAHPCFSPGAAARAEHRVLAGHCQLVPDQVGLVLIGICGPTALGGGNDSFHMTHLGERCVSSREVG